MTRGRHSLASRNARVQRLTLLAAPMITCAAVGAGIAMAGSDAGGANWVAQASASIKAAADRGYSASRDAQRVAVAPASPVVTGRLWSTAALDLRLTPEQNASTSGELAGLRRVAVTGVRRNGFMQVVLGTRTYWVSGRFLARSKPSDPASTALASTPCPGTSNVENGLKPSAIRVWEAVCNAFPQISTYGGYSPSGEHASGKAIDIMTSDVALGTQIADFLRAHASELNLYDVIWRQRIWTPVRASEGWRVMPDRGSPTANHENHVHVSTN